MNTIYIIELSLNSDEIKVFSVAYGHDKLSGLTTVPTKDEAFRRTLTDFMSYKGCLFSDLTGGAVQSFFPKKLFLLLLRFTSGNRLSTYTVAVDENEVRAELSALIMDNWSKSLDMREPLYKQLVELIL